MNDLIVIFIVGSIVVPILLIVVSFITLLLAGVFFIIFGKDQDE